MSSQRGNVSRTRRQKYQNTSAFKNDKYDKSDKMKAINSMVHEGLCQQCKSVIEWKIKYKKYKPLTQPATCIFCHGKTVKKAYHKVCQECAQSHKICAKCHQKKDIAIQPGPSEAEKQSEDAATQFELMQLSERKRRTVLRFIEKGGTLEEAGIKEEGDEFDEDFLDSDIDEHSDEET